MAIEATKEGIKFSCSGDIGNGSVTLRQHQNIDKDELSTKIDLTEPVALTFSLKYLVNFCKASSLSPTVTLKLSNEVPLLVEYKMENGYVRFYLAPKVHLPLNEMTLTCTDTLPFRLTRNKKLASRNERCTVGIVGLEKNLAYNLITIHSAFLGHAALCIHIHSVPT